MLGTIVNALAIIAGGLLGSFVIPSFPEQVKKTVMHGIGLAVLLIGTTMAMQAENLLVVIGSLVLGGLTGEALRIEEVL